MSFANCGLPYHIGGEIADKSDLLLQTPASLRARFNLDVRCRTEAVRIDRAAKTVELKDLETGAVHSQPYDALILAPGAKPLRPPIPGIDRPGHFVLRDVPDMEAIQGWLEARPVRKAVVVGGGYVGLEMAEQLVRRGIAVAVVEALPQAMAPLDPEMAAWLHLEMRTHGIDLHLGDAVASFEAPPSPDGAAASVVVLKSGVGLSADLVVLAIGVRPEVGLAREAGLEVGSLGGIRVDASLRTSDPDIFAIGDAIEVRNRVTGDWALIPLAGPANRQGRIAAENALGGSSRYEGTYGTAVLRLFDLAAGCTGANGKALKAAGIAFEAVHLHPGSHAGYFPGAEPIALKVLYAPETGKLLGAQVVGRDGVDKRIDVLATALKAGMTVEDISELELAYAPPFGSAKDPVNLAGMAARNVREGLMPVAQWSDIEGLDPASTLILDVRQDAEVRQGAIPGSIHIPVAELRQRMAELPRDREIVVYCRSGQRSYFAARTLMQNGFRVRNLTGAYRTWRAGTGQAAPGD